MKNLIGFALALLLPSAGISAAAPDKDTIITLENAIWRSVQDKKFDEFKKLVSANHLPRRGETSVGEVSRGRRAPLTSEPRALF